jgi:hypothetical protein
MSQKRCRREFVKLKVTRENSGNKNFPLQWLGGMTSYMHEKPNYYLRHKKNEYQIKQDGVED